jgi:carbon monoxide dehydrogenase subunit G
VHSGTVTADLCGKESGLGVALPAKTEVQMPTLEGSIQVSAPRQTVWDLISDVTRYPEMGNIAEEAHMVTPGAVVEGSVYSETGRIAGMKSTGEWTISHFDPPEQQTHVGGDSSMSGELTWTLTELGPELTEVGQHVEFTAVPQFRPVGALLEWLFLTKMMAREMGHIRDDIKRIAEAESA